MKKLVLLSVFLLFPVVVSAQPYTGAVAADSCETEPGTAVETPCQAGGNPEIYEAINYVFDVADGVADGANSLGVTPLTSNASADPRQTAAQYFNQLSGGGDASRVAVVAIGAGNTNTLGVYPFGNPGAVSNVVAPQQGFALLGTGTQADPFPGGVISLAGNFGFTLTSTGNGQTDIWYSDPAFNSDAIDHVMAFSVPELDGTTFYIDVNDNGVWENGIDSQIAFGQNAFVFAWEDLAKDRASFDNDYNDTIFLISRLEDIPVDQPTVPEPATMVLLGSGLLGMVGFRKKK